MSFAQSGEDVIVAFMLDHLGASEITYLDVGAYDPIQLSNTYFFYQRGHRGVLVEPNVTMCERLREIRPEDTTLDAGIGVSAAADAEYFVMSEPSWSTFSREEAEHQVEVTGGRVSIREVRRLPLLNINDVMAEHFDGPPTFLSVDAEGLSEAILESVDFERFRPNVICVETVLCGTTATIPGIPSLMKASAYVPRGSTLVNTIFVDSGIL